MLRFCNTQVRYARRRRDVLSNGILNDVPEVRIDQAARF